MTTTLNTLLTDAGLLRTQSYINGQWVDAHSGETVAVFNPATGEKIAEVPQMGAAEAEQAVSAAADALASWRQVPAKQRSQILRKWFDLMMEHQEDLARILTSEQGKPLTEAKGEIAYGASYIEWYAEEAKRIYGDIIPAAAPNQQILVHKEPIGVCAAITPWNFPNAMIARKIAPAIAAGCTIVVRPATQTPLSAFALAELAERAGLPAGVLNILSGVDTEIGQVLTKDPRVSKFSFTGSTSVGRLLTGQCASTIKKVSMELGGNAPFIVFDDADIDAAVQGAVASKFRNSGQTCVCTNRFYVQAAVYDVFVERFATAVEQLKLGNGLEAGTDLGPMIDQRAIEKVQGYLDDMVTKGGTVLTGGEVMQADSLFFKPTVLKDVDQSMAVAKEEVFGPLAPVFRFESEEEVVAYANDTEFGLASYVYTQDLGRAFRVTQALEYGMVAVNSGILSNEAAPFGGVKQSGLGREGSKYGIEDYLEIKYMLVSGI